MSDFNRKHLHLLISNTQGISGVTPSWLQFTYFKLPSTAPVCSSLPLIENEQEVGALPISPCSVWLYLNASGVRRTFNATWLHALNCSFKLANFLQLLKILISYDHFLGTIWTFKEWWSKFQSIPSLQYWWDSSNSFCFSWTLYFILGTNLSMLLCPHKYSFWNNRYTPNNEAWWIFICI